MVRIEKYHAIALPSSGETDSFIKFLYKHLDEFGDSENEIGKALQYALSSESGKGGFILAGYIDQELVCCVIMNKTGMEGYIPENILVYIATHKDYRGRGIGKLMVQRAVSEAKGNVALHVEHDNPALHLYKKSGFTNKYLEMRYHK